MSNRLRILMLEDDRDDAEIILGLLKRTGLQFDFQVVMEKVSFSRALEEFNPDIVLSDNSLPQFSATEALEIIKKQPAFIPFILITGTVSDEFAANIIKLGAVDYILKDRLTRLPAAIEAALQKKKSLDAIRLKEEEITFKANLLAAVGQAVIATNLQGIIIYWNNAAENIYGWSRDEAIGNPVVELIPSLKTKAEAREIIEQLKEGVSWSGEFMVQRKDGAVFPVFVNDSPIYDASGNLTGFIGVSNDISERKKAEQELKFLEESILDQKIQEQKKMTRAILKAQEQERNHIGQELHDNVTQLLAGAKLFLINAAQKSEEINSLIDYPVKLIENSIEEIRSLSSRHVTPLKNIDLKELIEALIDNLGKNTQLKFTFVYDINVASPDDEFKLNIYRIIQEQLNNIIKHAAAAHVKVLIADTENVINVEVHDDGKGFDLNQKRKGIGVSNMINRVASFNGTINIDSSPGKGTRIIIELPAL